METSYVVGFFLDSRVLAEAIWDCECVQFSHLTQLASQLANLPKPSRGLRKRVAAAVDEIIQRQECTVGKAFAWRPATNWDVLFSTELHKAPPPSQELADVLLGQWEATACTQPIAVYFDKMKAARFESSGPQARRITARLMLAEYWLSPRIHVYPPEPNSSYGGEPEPVPFPIRAPKSLPNSEVLMEAAVFKTRPKNFTIAFVMVPTRDERDATAIERFLTETLPDWQNAGNEYVILSPRVKGAPWVDFPRHHRPIRGIPVHEIATLFRLHGMTDSGD